MRRPPIREVRNGLHDPNLLAWSFEGIVGTAQTAWLLGNPFFTIKCPGNSYIHFGFARGGTRAKNDQFLFLLNGFRGGETPAKQYASGYIAGEARPITHTRTRSQQTDITCT